MRALSDLEEQMLATYYPRHGAKWKGWAEVLPDRTYEQIRRAASRRHIRYGGNCGPKPKERDELPPIESIERTVEELLASGMAPSQIDARQKWRRGTAAGIDVLIWRRDKESKEGKR
jgi:hypothetical protein